MNKGQESTSSVYDRQRSIHDQLVLDMLKFAKSTLGVEGIARAWDIFWPDAPSEDFRDHAQYHPLFLPWLFYLHVPVEQDDLKTFPSPHTLGAQFLRKRRHGQSDLVIETIEASCREPLLFWQIEDVDRGKGLHLKDVCTGRTVFAHDVAASQCMRKFDILFGQITYVDGIYTLNATAPYAIPPARYRSRIVEAMTGLAQHRSATEPSAWLEADIDFLMIYHQIVEELFDPPKPMLANTDGEPMVMTATRYTFDTAQRAAVVERLQKLPDIEADNDGDPDTRFRWTGTSSSQMMGTISKASITVCSEHIEVRANSMARDREFRALIERDLGDILRHDGTQHETVDLDTASESGATSEPLDLNSLSDEGREQLRQHIQQLYMKWADEKVPALGGITPREAVKTPDGRAKVIGLVNDWENTMGRGPEQAIKFDFEKLRRELGILEE